MRFFLLIALVFAASCSKAPTTVTVVDTQVSVPVDTTAVSAPADATWVDAADIASPATAD